MPQSNISLRQAIITQCKWMNSNGLNQGTSGNISVRDGSSMLVTPSATPYEIMQPEMIVSMDLSTQDGTWEGPLKPTTEWRFHLDILNARPDMNAIIHTHSTYATVLSMGHKEIPSCHYMVAAFGGNNVRCADYALYGTQELSNHALSALENRTACLLANHGMIVLGENLDQAMWRAIELETIAKQYVLSLTIGGPHLLSDAQIEETLAGFATYGLQDKD